MNGATPSFPAVKICGVTREEDARLAAELGARYVGLNFWPRSPRAVDPRRAAAIAAAAKAAGAEAVVGVFVNEERARIVGLAEEAGLDLVQLHGDEPAELVASFGPRRIEVVRANRMDEVLGDAEDNFSYLRRFQSRGPESGGGAPSGVGAAILATQGAASPAESGGTPDHSGSSPNWRSVRLELVPKSPTLPFSYLIDAPKDSRYGGTGESWGWASARDWIARRSRPVWIAGGLGPGNVVSALRASGAAGVDVASGVERAPGIKDPEKMRRMFEELRRATA